MKKLIFLVFVVITISGCATPGMVGSSFRKKMLNERNFPETTREDFIKGNIKLGMTKEQVLWIKGSPSYWTRYPTSSGVFESWSYHTTCDSYDFKDDKLIGYSTRGKYVGDNFVEDVRNFLK